MPGEYYFFVFLCIAAGIWTSFEKAKKSGARTDKAVVDGFLKVFSLAVASLLPMPPSRKTSTS